jgi:hypothetical protein
MQQAEILNHYRRLRAIGKRHHNAALDCLARPAIHERAKHLGQTHGQTMVVDSMEAMTLIFDLAVHTARPGRSRAIDRYARAASLSSDPDDARTLEALCGAQFSIWRVERYHEVAGLVVRDVLRESETWLIDEGLTVSLYLGQTFASRLCWPAEFAMTCGVFVPVDAELMQQVMLDSRAWLRRADPEQLPDDPRFATAIYHAALDEGVMDNVEFQESLVAA